MPETVTLIDDRAFRLCRKLTDIRISRGRTCVGDHVFDYCGV